MTFLIIINTQDALNMASDKVYIMIKFCPFGKCVAPHIGGRHYNASYSISMKPLDSMCKVTTIIIIHKGIGF